MQSRLGKYFAVGLLAVTLTGAALVGESSAQWGRFATPYSVNYSMNYYPAYPAYPAYVAWRPFGGLFAGVHAGINRLLCHGCWLSPCCCVTPVICDPCFDPCFNPCCTPCFDPCFDPCCNDGGGFGYSGSWRHYDQPASLSMGVPSSTGFGSITPSEGVPGQRPVGIPATQRANLPTTGRTLTTSPGTTSPHMPGVPDYGGQPNLAPPRNPSTFDPASKIEHELDGMTRPDRFIPDPHRYSDPADTVPSTGTEPWYNEPGGSPTPGGIISPPSGTPPQETPVQPWSGISPTNVNMMNLGTGTISVTVPDSAKVYINGYETKMPGVNRKYVVNDLEPGKMYDYEVRIVAQVNGQTVEETQYVTLAFGQQGVLAFGKPQPQSDNVKYIAARPVQ